MFNKKCLLQELNFSRSINIQATFVVVKQQLFCLTESKCVSSFQAIVKENLILDKISSSSPQACRR